MPPLDSSQGIVRFADFDLDLRAGELRKRGIRVKLQIQPFQVLQTLLERAGEVVTREELQKRIWAADTFVDFDQGLNNAVKKLREALGDDAEKPRFIETLSKRGYRFIAPLEQLGNEVRTAAQPAAVAVDSIVVLPLTNLSTDPENEFFADGITEEIINALAQIEQLHVVARSSAFAFKGKYIDPRIVGEQLNARTVLEGSVRRAENRLRITVQLVKATDGYHLWSERYDREMKDIFDIQDEIARSIADRLKVTLEGARQKPLVKVGTRNLEAYQLYLKGRALLYKRGSAIQRSVECCQEAVKLDPDYALAWAGLADSYTVLGYYGLVRPEASMPKAIEAARRAVALDASLSEAHNALAIASLMGSWDKAEAEREFLRALELNPRYVQARDWYALFYLQMAVGRVEEGIAQAKLAVEADPLSGYANAILGHTLNYAGNHGEAERTMRHAMKLDSDSFIAAWGLQAVLHSDGRFEEAVAIGELALAMSGRHPWAMASLATVFADWGKTADAAALYAELVARARRGYVQCSQLAIAAAAAGCEDETIRHARESFDIRDPMCPVFFSKRWSQSGRLRAYPKIGQIFAGMIWD